MQTSLGFLARCAAKLRALLGVSAAPVPELTAAPALAGQIRIIEIPAEDVVVPDAPRPLAAQIACQAKLNVPAGKKPRTASRISAKATARRPKVVAAAKKKAAKPRSVYLPARHMATRNTASRSMDAKSKPSARSNVVSLPVISLSLIARPSRQAKPGAGRSPLRIAA